MARLGGVQPSVLELVKPFTAGLVTFLALDLVWIGLVANQFYKRELAGLARMDGDSFAIRLGPALVLYPLIIVGLQAFALPRGAGARCGRARPGVGSSGSSATASTT